MLYNSDFPLIIIVGATASGKTNLAIHLAKHLGAEIISADSRQVYRGMDIGTGKDLEQYRQAAIPYHLIDIKEPGEKYHVNDFKTDFFKAFDTIQLKNKPCILCGGTAMYIQALIQSSELTAIPINEKIRADFENLTIQDCLIALQKYPVEYWQHVDLKSKKRLIRAIEIADYLQIHPRPKATRKVENYVFIGLVDEIENRRQKIKDRLLLRIQEGLIKEVKNLLKKGLSYEMLDYYGLEYRFVAKYLQVELSDDELFENLYTAIVQYAKRQTTFFRKLDREGANIYWIDASLTIDDQIKLALQKINKT